MDEKTLEKYIYSINKVLDTRNQKITESEFRMQIDQLGMTESELKYIEEQAKYYESQARTLYAFKNWSQAQQAVQKALSIRPYDINLYVLIIKIAYRAYLDTQSDSALFLMNTYAIKGFEIAPDKHFFLKMQELIKEAEDSLKKQKQYSLFKKIALIATIVGIFAFPACIPAFIAYRIFKKRLKKADEKLAELEKGASYLDLL